MRNEELRYLTLGLDESDGKQLPSGLDAVKKRLISFLHRRSNPLPSSALLPVIPAVTGLPLLLQLNAVFGVEETSRSTSGN
jgi:hypothetical protein